MVEAPLKDLYEATCSTRALERQVADLKLEVSSLWEMLVKARARVDGQESKIHQLTASKEQIGLNQSGLQACPDLTQLPVPVIAAVGSPSTTVHSAGAAATICSRTAMEPNRNVPTAKVADTATAATPVVCQPAVSTEVIS